MQVLLPDGEIDDLRRLARREKIPVDEWVRRALRQARAQQPAADPERRQWAIREAADCSFPTADTHQMLGEIEEGYLKRPSSIPVDPHLRRRF